MGITSPSKSHIPSPLISLLTLFPGGRSSANAWEVVRVVRVQIQQRQGWKIDLEKRTRKSISLTLLWKMTFSSPSRVLQKSRYHSVSFRSQFKKVPFPFHQLFNTEFQWRGSQCSLARLSNPRFFHLSKWPWIKQTSALSTSCVLVRCSTENSVQVCGDGQMSYRGMGNVDWKTNTLVMNHVILPSKTLQRPSIALRIKIELFTDLSMLLNSPGITIPSRPSDPVHSPSFYLINLIVTPVLRCLDGSTPKLFYG